jgi:prepilin-type processing-associated H-X9-DG protein
MVMKKQGSFFEFTGAGSEQRAFTLIELLVVILAGDRSRNVINDRRWVPTGDSLTARHNKKANVAFADGHVENVLPRFGTILANSRPDL